MKYKTRMSLFKLIKTNQLEEVTTLIEEAKKQLGFNLNAINKDGDTALIFSIKQRKYNIAEFLIEEGANVNIPNGKDTPLSLVAHDKKCTIIPLLLKKGADFGVMDSNPDRLLSHAVLNNQPELLEFLIKKGCAVNEPEDNLLYKAAVSSQKRITFELLIDAGADIHFLDDERNTLLHIIAKRGVPEAAECLIEKGMDINAKNKENHPPIYFAVRSKAMLQVFIDTGADTHFLDDEKNTLLHLAAKKCFSKPIKLLIQSGLDVNAKNRKGQTPLLAARSHKTIKVLIDGGADVTAEDIDKNTSLHLKASYCLKSVMLLIDAGANVNAKNKKGQIPLYFPCSRRTSFISIEEIIEYLIRKGSATFNHIQDLVACIEDNSLKAKLHALRNRRLKTILQNALPLREGNQRSIIPDSFMGFLLFTAPRMYLWLQELTDLNSKLQKAFYSKQITLSELRRVQIALFYLQTHQLRESKDPFSIKLLMQWAIDNHSSIFQVTNKQLKNLESTHKKPFASVNLPIDDKHQTFFKRLFTLPPELFDLINNLCWLDHFTRFIEAKLPNGMQLYCRQWIPYLIHSRKAKEHLKPWCQEGCPIIESSQKHETRPHTSLS